MNKNHRERHAAKGEIAPNGGRTSSENCPVIVVGIGASAGGVKSLKQLFAGMPTGHGVAFVLIQHLEATHENPTVELLRDQTALAVVEAKDGMPVLADRIHVMPSDKFLNINQCTLTLQEPVYCNGLRMPVDHFFCSLGPDQGPRGCAVLLSGSGSDGTLGLSEIKAAGGRTFAEEPGSAEFPDMPQSAIDAGVVDEVLPADAIAEAIVALAKQVTEKMRSQPGESPEFDSNLRAILDILRANAGHDFRCYKPSTLVRRIRRRMTLGKVATFADYARFLGEHPEEVIFLHKDLLIGVTEFFRQPQAWEVLEEKVIAALVKDAQPGSEIRVWVPGCSTGKEVYSLAILLAERIEKSGKKLAIQIFATDSDAAALSIGRTGNYLQEEIGQNVSAERRRRFFARKEGGLQVIKEIRGWIVFAPQNITADPPFSKLDLISCRNLLIYLDQEAQKKIIPLFHFALREGGFLFLGTAETIGDREDLFEPVSKKWRIYRRIGVGRPVDIEMPVRPSGKPLSPPGKPQAAASPPRVSLTAAAQQMLLDRFAPACVMIDRKLQVLYVHGAVEGYLTFPAGELTTRVVDMAREGLRARLRGAISKCLEVNRAVSVTARVRRGEKSVPVKATVSPQRYPRETDGLLIITFEDCRISAAKSRRKGTADSDVQELQDELKVTREELQSTIEQLESSNDQLKASNEEVTAANEELQSANEEMETSKEELQSLNEELNTINGRLQEKVDELEGTKNDLLNLLTSTSIATVFLDKELKVRRYTPASTRLFSLIPSDAGRPIMDVLRRFSDEGLVDDARRVLADLTPLSKEVQAEDGGWYIRRITPYRTQDDRIEGVVITFVDVCDLKQTQEALQRKQAELEAARTEAENGKRRLEAVMDALPVGMAITDVRGGNVQTNRAYETVWGEPRPPAHSVSDYSAYKAWWPDTGRTVAREEWASAQAVRKGEPVVGQLIEIQRFDGGRAFVINSASPVRDAAGHVIGSAVAIQDITKLRKAEEALRISETRLRLFIDNVPIGVIRWTMDGKVQEANDRFLQMVGYSRMDLLEGRIHWSEMTPSELHQRDREAIAELKATGTNVPYEKLFIGKDGSPVPVLLSSVMIDPEYSWEGLAFVLDLTERKQAEDEMARLASFPMLNPQTVVEADLEGRVFFANPSARRLFPDLQQRGSDHPWLAGWKALANICLEGGANLPGREVVVGDRWYHQTMSFVQENRRIRIYGLDITERKQAEEALRQLNAELEQRVAEQTLEIRRTCESVEIERQRLYEVLEALPAYVVLLTPDYHVPFANRFFRERFGESHGRQCYHYLFGRTEPCEICETYKVLKTNAPHHWEWTGPDGRVYDIHDFPFTDTGGSPLIMEMGIDITERKQAEEQVRERTAELAMANERLRQLSAQLLSTQEDERRRIALDIHDSLGGSLGAIKFRVQRAIHGAEAGDAASILEALQSAIPLIQETADECRRIQMDLRPAMLDDLGILSTVSWFCRKFQTIYPGIQIEQEFGIDESEVPEFLKITIFRVTQETLNNVAKHSRADHVRFSLWRTDDRVELTIQDNGIGFDVEEAVRRPTSERGVGVSSLRERTRLSGGSFSIDSAIGKGTTIHASWALLR